MTKRRARLTKRERKLTVTNRASVGDLLQAFKLANSYALGTSIDGELLNCSLAACSGAAALRSFGVNARPVLCSAMAWRNGNVTQVGHSAESGFQALSTLRARLEQPPLGREEFFSTWTKNFENEYPHHVIIEIALPGQPKFFIDPTAAQLGEGTGLRVPLESSWSGELSDGRFAIRDGLVEYQACQHAGRVDRKYLRAVDDVLVSNYIGTMRLALDALLDEGALAQAVAEFNPVLVQRRADFLGAVVAKYGTQAA